jgi:chemotaxis protein MotA
MNYLNLLDGLSAAIVLGGTLIGTILRCGVRNFLVTLAVLLRFPARRFDAAHARAELAVQIQDIRRDGLIRAEPHHFGDREFDEVTDALIERRSIGALLEKHKSHRDRRITRNEIAISTLNQATELAPVFGLAGTLISLSQIPTTAAAGNLLATSIPMAIVTTLYGLLTAHLLFAPLARLIERHSSSEETQRQQLVDWLAEELRIACAGKDLEIEKAAA